MNPQTSQERQAIPTQVEILLVDDRDENLLTLEAVLDHPGYKLVKAVSGEAALRYLLDHKPALILLDVQMPGLDGFETAEIIKGSPRTREIPIIFLTAYGKEDRYMHQGYRHGAVDYLSKPFDPHILRSKVSVFAELHRKNEMLLQTERQLRAAERKEKERKIAELEIRSLRREQIEQKRYRELVEGIEHGIVWSAPRDFSGFSFVSKPAERILGFPLDRWISEPEFWRLCIHPDDEQIFQKAVEKSLSDSKPVEVEHRLVTSDGRILWFQTGIRIGTDKEGNEGEICGLSVEITKIKEAEALLKASKTRSEALAYAGLATAESFSYLDALPKLMEKLILGYASWAILELRDSTGERELVTGAHRNGNLSSRAIECWKQSALVPLEKLPATCWPYFGPKESAGFPDDIQALLSDLGIISAIQLPLQIRGSTVGILFLGKERDRFTDGDLEIGLDLATRISASVDNWRLYMEAERAVRIRDEFLSIASHELKTPITPLKIQVQQLLRILKKNEGRDLDPEKSLKMLQVADQQINRLTHLVEDLLDISRITMGKIHLNLDTFQFDELLSDIRQRFSSQLAAAGCELKISCPPGLTVKWDYSRTEQVVVNLLTNAIKYGEGKPIELQVEQKNESIVFSVRDYGIGIPKEHQERIFERFERAVSSAHYGGLGLGLFIVNQIVAVHGGKVVLDSEVGRGSRFSVSMPQFVETAGDPPSRATLSSHLQQVGS